jgi:pilus assembly protein Flp/PilA
MQLMRTRLGRWLRRSNARGQGMTEAVIIVALVAIGSIGLVGLFGNNIRGLFGASSDSVAGNSSVTSGNQDSSGYSKQKTLGTFGDNAGQGGGGGGGNGPTP